MRSLVYKIFTKDFWLRVDHNANKEVFDGDRKETMSARMGRRLLKGYKGFLNWRHTLCEILSFIEKVFTKRKDKVRHCIESIKEEKKV